MKRIFTMILCCIMLVSLTACSNDNATVDTKTSTETSETAITDEWQFNIDDTPADAIPEEVSKAFASATNSDTDVDLTPIAYLGNKSDDTGDYYRLICWNSNDKDNSICIADVLIDDSGNTNFNEVRGVSMETVVNKGAESAENSLYSCWTTYTEQPEIELESDAKWDFLDMMNVTNNQYDFVPLAYLGHQTTEDGTTRAYLCRYNTEHYDMSGALILDEDGNIANAAESEPQTELKIVTEIAIVTVYLPKDSSAELLNYYLF